MKSLVAAIGMLALCPIARADEPKPFPGQASRWEGFVRHDFRVDGADVIVVEPDKPLPGRPWAWRGEFFGAFPNADIALVKAGWHLAYVAVPDQFGSPRAVARWEKVYDVLVEDHRLSPRPALIGLSRGALYCLAWAAAHPDKTLLVYLDNGVCDFRSWPGGKPKGLGTGKGSPEEWAKLLKAYDFKDDREAIASEAQPGGPPGAARQGEDPDPAGLRRQRSGRPARGELGGRVRPLQGPGRAGRADRQAGADHHPHGLADPRPIVEFFGRMWRSAAPHPPTS